MSNLFNTNPGNGNFNPTIRDNFVKNVANKLSKKSKVLDVSSGTKPYKHLFEHCEYISHEFEGNKIINDSFRNENSNFKNHDIYSPINNIPVEDNSFDFIICTEVFEHIPEPIKAMEELVRICKKNGKILITAPFTSGIHQEPYHFYSGFSPFFYNYLKEKYNLEITEFKSQGDMFLLNCQEIGRCFSHLHPLIQNNIELKNELFTMVYKLKNYALNMSKYIENDIEKYNCPERMLESYSNINHFTIGYCVLFTKK